MERVIFLKEFRKCIVLYYWGGMYRDEFFGFYVGEFFFIIISKFVGIEKKGSGLRLGEGLCGYVYLRWKKENCSNFYVIGKNGFFYIGSSNKESFFNKFGNLFTGNIGIFFSYIFLFIISIINKYF